MATSRDPEELKRAWLGWHAVGAPMRQRYARMVELGNQGSRELGYADVGALWRSNYDMPPDNLQKELDRTLGATAARSISLCTPTCAANSPKNMAKTLCRPTARFPPTCSAISGRRNGTTSTT